MEISHPQELVVEPHSGVGSAAVVNTAEVAPCECWHLYCLLKKEEQLVDVEGGGCFAS